MNVLAVEPGNAKALESRDAALGPVTIRLSGTSKDYSGVAALSNVSVEFYAGEVHAVLGENGAGKSTLMSVISGVTQPDAGEIEFEGRQVSPMSPETAAALGISISYQHAALLDDLSVVENLRVALPQSVFQGRPVRDVASEMLSALGLEIPLRARGDSLTVAQKQLLEIAKALAMRPKVLILDEPTASLDRESTELLFDRIRAVVKTGTSVIYITHRLAEVRRIAHRVTVLARRSGAGRGPGDPCDGRKSLEHDYRSRSRIDVSAESQGCFGGSQLIRPGSRGTAIQECELRSLAWTNHWRGGSCGQRSIRVDAGARWASAV